MNAFSSARAFARCFAASALAAFACMRWRTRSMMAARTRS